MMMMELDVVTLIPQVFNIYFVAAQVGYRGNLFQPHASCICQQETNMPGTENSLDLNSFSMSLIILMILTIMNQIVIFYMNAS